MNFNIIPTDKFQKQVKTLYKKYQSILSDIESLAKELSENYKIGTDLGNNTFKIRLAIKSKRKGKSGGGRILYFVVTENNEIYLAAIYDKSEIDTLKDNEIKKIIDDIKSSLE